MPVVAIALIDFSTVTFYGRGNINKQKEGKGNMEWRWRKASFTLEAAFVVPVLLGIAFMLMYVMFLLHDRAVLQGNFLYVLCRVAEDKEEKTNCEKLLSKSLWSAKLDRIKIERKTDKVCGEVHGKLVLKIPVMSFFIKEIQHISCSGEYYYIQPEQTILIKEAVKK